LARATGSRLRSGAFASASWTLAAPVRVFGALRWDRVADGGFSATADDDDTQAWSPRVGVVVRPGWLRGASAFAQVSRAFKAPTLDQKFDPRPYPDFRGGTFTISNALLQAQEASNVEVGLSGGGALRWSVLAYRMHVDNEIDFDARTFSYANIGRSRHTGVEAEVQGPAAARVRPVATYTLSGVTALDAAGDFQLKNVPRHQATIAVGASLGWRLESYVAVRRAWGAFLDDGNLVPVRSGTLVDLRVRRPVGRTVVFADVLNAANQQYDEFGFVLEAFSGGAVAYVYPGQPRVVRVGLTLALN
jgi:outer membrane cobalamin receptor